MKKKMKIFAKNWGLFEIVAIVYVVNGNGGLLERGNKSIFVLVEEGNERKKLIEVKHAQQAVKVENQ